MITTGITVPATSNGPIPVSWNASPTATRYDLYQNINNAGWTLVASVSATSVTVTATTSGGYQFFVAAYNASGWNGAVNNSSLVTVTIPPGSAPTLSVPASNVEELKKFNRLIAGDERSVVVLKPAPK